MISTILSYNHLLLGLYLQRVPYSLYTFVILITLGSVLSAIHFWTLDFLRELIRAVPYLTLTEFDTLHPCWDGQTSTNSIMRPCTYSWKGIHKVNHKRSLFQIKIHNLSHSLQHLLTGSTVGFLPNLPIQQDMLTVIKNLLFPVQ